MLTPEQRLDHLHTSLRARLDTPARIWLTTALTEAAQGAEATPEAVAPPAWETRFASAGRCCTRREPPHEPDPEAAEAARVLMLCTARADAPTVTRLAAHGTAAERRAVLLALPYLELGPAATPLVEDALRTNDTWLVAAAVGPYAARHLDAHAWRHAVLKCLFTGVPLSAVAELAHRARGDAELARMLRDYARERTAAGRALPDDLHRALALTEPSPAHRTPVGPSPAHHNPTGSQPPTEP
ncbi:EboA domain-containing protein [Streptomyces decoyicus]|uniref:EboA domain-containing protein n=1 Tax=Streptomyces decoyicus TaxID=249567 RepID=UPI0033AEC16F